MKTKMKMSFLKLAFQHLAHPANAFERCLVFYFVKYYYYFEPDSCTITATLATPKQKKTSVSTSLGLSHYLVYFALCLYKRYTELGSICFMKITCLLPLSATI
ncbi:hypothetical protein BD560DRAFT_386442 [Blakeslea trispora]|nr:hypothetical protein BD560DRAFT_386442 [Blakeslea trispora]